MRKMFLLFFIVSLVFGCSNEHKTGQLPVQNVNARNNFLGTWFSIERVYPYFSTLTIKPDSTFGFQYGACIASGFSTGKWIIKNNLLILISNVTDSCYYTQPFETKCELVEEIIDDSTRDVPKFVRPTTKDCKPKTDEDYVIFSNERFYIKNDTLKHIPRSKRKCLEIKDDFSRNCDE